MTRTFALLVLSLLAAMPATAQSSAQSNPVARSAAGGGWQASLTRFEAWLTAVVVHQPGTADAAAQIVAAWSTDQIERELLPVLVIYLNLARAQNGHLIYPNKTCAPCKLSGRERERLGKATGNLLTGAELNQVLGSPPPRDLDRLILDGVLLHSDVAMLLPVSTQSPPSAPPAGPMILGLPRNFARTGDGQFENMISTGPHWHLARALLHFLTKDAAGDPHAREWYSTVSAHFARAGNFAALSSHLQVARQLFDDDSRTAFAEGWQAEGLASPLVQEGVRTTVVTLKKEAAERALAAQKRGENPLGRGQSICEFVDCITGRPFGIKNERLNLLDAEKHYSEAVSRDPQFTEAHVRLARVRSLLGKHAEAASILQRLPNTEDKTLMFYARLFLGAVQEALGKLDDAATAYTSALALFPASQSAHLAMSGLAQRRGDGAAAQAHVKRALASTNANGYTDDPFQSYSMGLGRQADALWRAWHAGVRAQQ